MNSKRDEALARFSSGYNCAQAVFEVFADDLRLDRSLALRLACGFGGGVARCQELCGALSGGVLALNCRYGRGLDEDRSATDVCYSKIETLVSRFEKEHGSRRCRDLLCGCDLKTPEGRKSYADRDLAGAICQPCVRTVVEILEEIL